MRRIAPINAIRKPTPADQELWLGQAESKLHFHVVTLFPEMIENAARFGVVGQAIQEGKIALSTLSPRVFTANVHQTVDDRPFGGGDGMVMLADPLESAVASIRSQIPSESATRVIHFSPRGVPLTDQKVRELSAMEHLILISSRYGGVDQRFLNQCVDEEISIGDYVLSGGEIPALVLIDSVGRQMPGVLGNERSSIEESFSEGTLEHPQYTRPRQWRQAEVPQILLSGDHAKIAQWKRQVSLYVTAERRPDLLSRERVIEKLGWTKKSWIAALDDLKSRSDEDMRLYGIEDKEEVESVLVELREKFFR